MKIVEDLCDRSDDGVNVLLVFSEEAVYIQNIIRNLVYYT